MLHYLKVMKNAVRNGFLFPHIGQRPTQAPQGSEEVPTAGSPFLRLTKEVHWFRHSEHHVPIPNLQQRLHILHLTDVHLRDEGPWLESLLNHLRGLQPDILALTGDIVTSGWESKAVDHFLANLPKGRIGSYATLGNWEHWTGATPPSWAERMQRHNIRLLVEDYVEHDQITVAGTDDHLAGQANASLLLQKLPVRPTIVLTHSPAFFTELAHPPVNLVLAGHAHGGQIRLPLLGPVWVPKGTGSYVSGWYQHNDVHLFVSRGIGWSVAPLRHQCPPEIASIFLHPA